MTEQQKELIVKLGGLSKFQELFMDTMALLLEGEATRADAAYAAKQHSHDDSYYTRAEVNTLFDNLSLSVVDGMVCQTFNADS